MSVREREGEKDLTGICTENENTPGMGLWVITINK